MPVPVFWHPACRLHDPGPGHPERPERVEAVLAALRQLQSQSAARLNEATPASAEAVQRVHPRSYCDHLQAVAAQGGGMLDADTFLNAHSWDVHHGNGTQALVERDPTIRYVSLHQYPWYPGTGAADERGVGNVFNVPRPPGLPRRTYVRDLLDAVRAATDGWTPGLMLVSAGYDCLHGDPLGGFTLEPDDTATWTTALREIAQRSAAPVVAVLEGGYALDRLTGGVVGTVRALG